jgi:enoyl-CoA hydratase/carnithine racemase
MGLCGRAGTHRASIGAMGESSSVTYTVDGPLGIVRLNRPEKLNAFTFVMIQEIRAAVDRAAADPDVVAVVITGEGRAFSAGLDTTDLTRSTEGDAEGRAEPSADEEELPALFSHLLRVSKPVIAAVNGVAAGGGFVLAMASDLRFASDTASFTTAFSKRGLIAEHLTSWLLPRIVGTSRALDLLWSARRMDVDEAYRIGFVDRVVPGDRLLDEVKGYVTELAEQVSRRSMAVMKAQVYGDWSRSMRDAALAGNALVNASLDHPDAKEGVQSFLERRPPRFAPWTGGRP